MMNNDENSQKNVWEKFFEKIFFRKPSKKIFSKKFKKKLFSIDSPYEISHIGVVLNKKIRAAKPRGLRLVGVGLGKGLGNRRGLRLVGEGLGNRRGLRLVGGGLRLGLGEA